MTPGDMLLNVTVRDLRPATSYEVAIAANNVIGNSSYSQSVTMTTQEISKICNNMVTLL